MANIKEKLEDKKKKRKRLHTYLVELGFTLGTVLVMKSELEDINICDQEL